MEPKFPHVTVKLTEMDGNPFLIMTRVRRAMKDANVAKEDIDAYTADATSGNYDHLLQVTMQTVETE